MLNVRIAPETLAYIGPIPITGALIAAGITSLILIVSALLLRRSIGIIPSRGQVALEFIVNYLEESLTRGMGAARARRFLPLILTLFLFIALANQLALLPILSEITLRDTPLLRIPTSDLAQTLALALLVLGISHLVALSQAPLKHLGNFFKIAPLVKARSGKEFGMALLGIFTGTLDIIGEFAKVLSLSARLFGNIFAGNIIIVVIIHLSRFTTFFVPMPFLILGIFSGFVQAFVFTLLSVQFLSGTIMSVSENEASA